MSEIRVIVVIVVVILIIWYATRRNNLSMKETFNAIRKISDKYGICYQPRTTSGVRRDTDSSVSYQPANFSIMGPGPGKPSTYQGKSHRDPNSYVNPNQGPLTIARPNGTYLQTYSGPPIDHDDIPLPTTFTDWISAGNLLQVLDQNQCGDCWAFAICEMMAQRLNILTKGKISTPLSTQYLNSCYNGSQGAMGCGGGIPELVMRTIHSYGVISSADYPYRQTNETTLPCANLPKTACIYRMGVVTPLCIQKTGGSADENQLNLTQRLDPTTIAYNVQQMKTDIYLNGPIIAAIECYNDLMQTFRPTSTNVYVPNLSSGVDGGHAIVIVGWSQTPQGVPYWICQNSWGENWGYGLDSMNPRNSRGGYWNHIMGQNACEIEGFCVSAIPNMTDPCIQSSLPSSTSAYTPAQLEAWSGTGSQTIRALIT